MLFSEKVAAYYESLKKYPNVPLGETALIQYIKADDIYIQMINIPLIRKRNWKKL
jgi:hypothetical protein